MNDSDDLRPIHWHDLADLAEAERAIFGASAWDERSWWAELAARPRREYIVARSGGQLSGYGGIDQSGDVADIMTMATLPHARGRGLGGRILDHLLARARERGCESVMLEVRADNDAAQALYASRGFVQVNVRPRYYQPEGVDALILRASLEQHQKGATA